jgi:ribosomal protein L27
MVKKAPKVQAVKRRDGRYVVRQRGGKLLHGEEKTKFLQEQGLVKVLKSKPKAES